MATYALTIAGTPVSIKAGSLRITETINGRNTMSFDVVSWTGSYRPAMGAEVIYTEDSTRLFGGLVDLPAEQGVFSHGGTKLLNKVSAVDFNAYAERRYVNGIIPAGTLKDALIVLEPYLTPYGVTLDPAQVIGPAVPLLYLPMVLMRDVLDQLSVLTGYVWEIDYNKVLRMIQPGSEAAPFNVVPAVDASVVLGDIVVESVRTEYANRIIVLAGTGIRETTDTFVGDSSTVTFPLRVSMTGYPTVTVNGTSVSVGVYGVDTHLEWVFRSSDNAVVQLPEAPTGTFHSPLTGGDALVVVYPGQHPFQVQSNDAGEQASQGLWEKVISEPDVFEVDAAQALADAYLDRHIISLKGAAYPTRESGVRPGQTQTMTVPDRNLSGTFLITDVETTDTVDHGFLRIVKVVGGTTYPGSWRDWYRDGGGGRSGGPSTPSISGTPSAPTSQSSWLAHLGGSRAFSSAPNPAAWTPVHDYVSYTAKASFGGRVRAELFTRNAGITATCRLYNVTDSAVVATSSGVTSQTATEVTFLVGLATGKKYRLEVISSSNGEGVFCIGSLESA